MRTRIERLWPLLALALIVAIVLLSFPYLASAYYLEAGGRAMDDPKRAEQLLNRAIRWDQENAQAYRLLGKLYGTQGELGLSARAIERYVELKAENPLGHMELAQTYESMETMSSLTEGPRLSHLIAHEWNRAGLTSETFIAAGEAASQMQQYDEALLAYRRALRLEPDLGDPWYHIGRVYSRQKRWTEALEAYKLASASARVSRIHRSSAYYHSGLIYQDRLSPPQLEAALVAHKAALMADDFQSVIEAADCHYRRGWLQRALGARPEEYITDFQRAIDLDPEHSLAQAFLGLAYYERDQDVEAAEAQVLRALELPSNVPWVYVILGDLYQEVGRVSDARVAYQKALAIAPGFSAAQTRLDALEDSFNRE